MRTFCHSLAFSPEFIDYGLSRRRFSFRIEHVLLTSLPTREFVLGRLAALVKNFVKTVSLARGLSKAAAETAGGKIFTFGSYRLGVHGPGSEIDVMCRTKTRLSRRFLRRLRRHAQEHRRCDRGFGELSKIFCNTRRLSLSS